MLLLEYLLVFVFLKSLFSLISLIVSVGLNVGTMVFCFPVVVGTLVDVRNAVVVVDFVVVLGVVVVDVVVVVSFFGKQTTAADRLNLAQYLASL